MLKLSIRLKYFSLDIDALHWRQTNDQYLYARHVVGQHLYMRA